MRTHSDSGADLLLRHAAGNLDAAFSLLVETHLSLSEASRRLHAQFEELGGLILDEITPVDVDPAAFNYALKAIENQKTPLTEKRSRLARHPKMPGGFTLPSPLKTAHIDPWRWIAPGLRSARIAMPKGGKSRAFLLEIAPGVTVPRHGHEGDEVTCVLKGGFRDGDAHYGPGDIARVDERVEHDILIDAQESCLCLIAMEGQTRPSSWFGRFYQKFRYI